MDSPFWTINSALGNASRLKNATIIINILLLEKQNIVLLVLAIAQYVALILCGSMVSVKKPRYEASLHCKSRFKGSETSTSETTSAASGVMKLPNGEAEVTIGS